MYYTDRLNAPRSSISCENARSKKWWLRIPPPLFSDDTLLLSQASHEAAESGLGYIGYYCIALFGMARPFNNRRWEEEYFVSQRHWDVPRCVICMCDSTRRKTGNYKRHFTHRVLAAIIISRQQLACSLLQWRTSTWLPHGIYTTYQSQKCCYEVSFVRL